MKRSVRFRVDGGKPPGIRFGGSARRCRALLGHPSSTVLDLRLFAQVEVCFRVVALPYPGIADHIWIVEYLER